MNKHGESASPAAQQCAALASEYGLENHGLTNLGRVYWNLTARRCTKRPSSVARAPWWPAVRCW